MTSNQVPDGFIMRPRQGSGPNYRVIDPQLIEIDNAARRDRNLEDQHEQEQYHLQHGTMWAGQDERQNTAQLGTWMDLDFHLPGTEPVRLNADSDMLTEVERGVAVFRQGADLGDPLIESPLLTPTTSAALFDSTYLPQAHQEVNYPYPPYHQLASTVTPYHPIEPFYNPFTTPPPSESRPALNPHAPVFTPMDHDHLAGPSANPLGLHVDTAQMLPGAPAGPQIGLPTPSSSTSANLAFRPASSGTPTRSNKRRRGQSWVNAAQFHPDTAQQQPLQPVDVQTWTEDTRTNLYQSNQLEVPAPTPGPSKKVKTASVALSSTSYPCPSEGCVKLFEKRADLEHHRRYHEAKRWPCSLCDKCFHFNKDLKRHMKTHTPNERHLMCTVLGCTYNTKGFQRSDHLQRHMQKVHQQSGAVGGSNVK